ncbi:hypothetical protein ACFO4O_11750 [Glaciecola siphonariae]|uniref:Polysaccharide biosynthesis protein n=1 Tax=Glaciecola siphonariae TaxID=521012 RepID=A0ABV9LWB8_9ALTE
MGKIPHIKHLSKLFNLRSLQFAFLLVTGQAATIFVGIFLARTLSIHDYSIYVIVMMLSALSVSLSSGGINIGFTSSVGKAWPEKSQVSGLLSLAIKMRNKQAAVVFPLILLFAFFLLYRNEVNIFSCLLLLTLIAVNLYLDINTRLFERILSFRRMLTDIQKINFFSSILRLASILLCFTFGLLTSETAYIITILALLLKMNLTKQQNTDYYNNDSTYSKEQEAEFSSINKRQYPSTIFDCIKGQIAVGILAVSANSELVAAYGALSKVTQIYLPILILLQTFAIAHFAQIQQRIIANLSFWLVLSLLPGLFLVSISSYYPHLILNVLGPNYTGFSKELLLMSLSVTFTGFTNVFYTLVINRGWNKYVSIQIPLVAIWLCYCFVFLDFSILTNIIFMNALIPLGLLIATFVSLIDGIRSRKMVK